MTSSYAHVMDRPATTPSRLESPITANLDTLQAKKNFSVSHLLDLEEAAEMVGSQADEGVGEAGRSLLESPGLTSGSDTTQQESLVPEPESQVPQKMRAMLASKNASLLKSYSGDVTAVEQPIVPRPAPRPNDYLSWGSAAPYSAMATYPPTCSNTNTSQGMNMANSIANLRLKAKEYSLNQVPTVN
ncbi:unnamed protein product [Tetraodon nigroviridis]|uniref:(spotted green pufferfish) hypothetical protein n=1 Tax=Tetraodon nigroviridis TaxID=99883 RepID=Q4SZ23_TETNG|nr:unnamed protein product [Tetraodon nigroviridis]